MSVTLRYDIGLGAAEAIRGLNGSLLQRLGVSEASRWVGLRNPRRDCITFAVKLPSQIEDAVRLCEISRNLSTSAGTALARMSCKTLYRKLGASLGFPSFGFLPSAGEKPFYEDAKNYPGDLNIWFIYSDWLQDQEYSTQQQRGLVMTLWLATKKAAKVRYGVIMVDGKQVAY